jgi:hypothetical protein
MREQEAGFRGGIIKPDGCVHIINTDEIVSAGYYTPESSQQYGEVGVSEREIKNQPKGIFITENHFRASIDQG